MAESASIEPEVLLRESTWLQALAEGIVHDEHAAEDVVQTTYLRALTHPPRSAGALRAWLGQVTRRFAYRAGDRARWGRRREEAAARAEAQPSAGDLVTRASLHRAVVDAVLALDEPQRSTVLMRFFEELPPREIARRHGVPVATVRSRLRRALDHLREALDRTTGGREAWMSGLGIMTAPIVAAGGAAAGAAVTTTTATATNLKLAAAAVLLLVVGAIGWRWTRPADHAAGPSPAAPRSRSDVVPAVAQPDDDAPARGATTRRIVPRRAIADADRSGSQERVIGIAVDEDTGKPLEGAVVSLFREEAPPVETVTPADGSFALPKSSYWDPTVDRLVIVARDHVRWEEPEPYPRSGRGRVESRISRNDIDFGTIPIERGAVISGRVVAAGDRKPISGAALFLRKNYPNPSPPHARAVPVGTSGTDGAFTLPERLSRRSHAWVIAVHPLGVDWALAYATKGNEAVSLEIVARAGSAVPVRVVDDAARPVANALVLAIPRFQPLGDYRSTWPPSPEPEPPDSPVRALAARFLATTDATGAVTLGPIPEGRIEPMVDRESLNATRLFAFKEGFEPASTEIHPPYSAAPVTLILNPHRQREVTGAVRKVDGTPIAGASVELLPGRRSVSTNGAGEYRIVDGLPVAAEVITIAARAPGFAYAERVISFVPGNPELQADFSLTAAAPISGKVVDEAGKGVAGVGVGLRSNRKNAPVLSVPEDRNGRTRDDGSFSFSMADDGVWSLDVSPGGAEEGWDPPRERPIRGGETVVVVLRRAASGQAQIVAEVVDAATGAPLDPAATYLGPAHATTGDRSWPRPLEISRGRVVATDVPPGKWKLFAGALGYGRRTSDVFVGAADETIKIRMALGRTGVVIAHVALDGIPEEKRPERITIWAPDARWVTEPGKPSPNVTRGCGVATDANGWTCRFEDVAPDVPLRFWIDGKAFTDEQLLTIGSGETRAIELRPKAAGSAKFSSATLVTGGVALSVADERGYWHWVTAGVLDRPAVWTHEFARPPGTFRWRVEVLPLDVPPRLREPRFVEGEATIEAGKATEIAVEIPE